MNFLMHRHLAWTAHGSDLAGAGAMLPDLWRMADRRVRTAPKDVAWELVGDAGEATREIMRGIDHHLDADDWFHQAPVFREGERATAAALRGSAVAAKKLVLFAHPLWEMCLDGALVRRLGEGPVRAAVARGFASAEEPLRAAAHAHHFAHVTDGDEYRASFEAHLRGIADALSNGPWIGAYARPEGLSRALGGMRKRLGLPPFGAEDLAKLDEAIGTLEARADAGVKEILERGSSG